MSETFYTDYLKYIRQLNVIFLWKQLGVRINKRIINIIIRRIINNLIIRIIINILSYWVMCR